jgi:hypothetical protein
MSKDLKDELLIRLHEQIRVYKDSPSVHATYIDLVRLIEDIIQIIEMHPKGEIGFKPYGQNTN